jgi:hypothetical protein
VDRTTTYHTTFFAPGTDGRLRLIDQQISSLGRLSPISPPMLRHALATVLLAGWVLMFNAEPDDRRSEWRQVGRYPTSPLCEYALTGEVRRISEQRIGSVLASQPADNPMRQSAFGRAYDRAQKQYRCVSE